MNNIHHIFDDYSMFYYIHSHNNHLYILHDKYKFPIKKNKINNRIFQCLLNRFTFVVAVFVTKQVPPFSHGFVKQKTNCERFPVATVKPSVKPFTLWVLSFDELELPKLAITANVSASNCLYSTRGK